jgi:hypothetical protein
VVPFVTVVLEVAELADDATLLGLGEGAETMLVLGVIEPAESVTLIGLVALNETEALVGIGEVLLRAVCMERAGSSLPSSPSVPT